MARIKKKTVTFISSNAKETLNSQRHSKKGAHLSPAMLLLTEGDKFGKYARVH